MPNKNNLVTTVLKLAKITEEIEGDRDFLDEEQFRWNNYISFQEIRKGKEDRKKYRGIKYETKRDKEENIRGRKQREVTLEGIYKDTRKAERILKEAEMLGYNKLNDFRKLASKLEKYVSQIKNRKEKSPKLKEIPCGGTGTP